MTMDNRTYGFNRSDAEALILTIGGSDAEFPEIRPRGMPPIRHALTKAGGLSARSSGTMGSGTCDLLLCSSAGVLTDSGEDVTVYNDSAAIIGADAGTYIKIARNDAGLWVLITNSVSVQQVITDVRIDGLVLQKKTRDVLIYSAGAESSWTAWHTGAECEDA